MTVETHSFIGSSRVDSASYDPDKQVVSVSFVRGKVYSYSDVTPSEWSQFKTASSPGKFLQEVLLGRESYD